jgi:Uri superfamily endonuclease
MVLGAPCQSGVYALRIALDAPCHLAIGRFRGGAALHFPAGEYVYIGSALAPRGTASLAPRLLRHATRSGERPPHAMRQALFDTLAAHGLGGLALKLPRCKKCFWHVDFLLDQPAASLAQVLALRTQRPLERLLARRLAADAVTRIIAPGLGASDYPGATHLYHIRAPDGWWAAFTAVCAALLNNEEPLR